MYLDDDAKNSMFQYKNRHSYTNSLSVTLVYLLRLGLLLTIVIATCLNSSQAEPIQGRIEHVERLPSVGTLLKPGAHYDQTSIQKVQEGNNWARIPDWLAGTWTASEETAVYRENYRTGKKSTDPYSFGAKSKFSYGKQQDRQGQIWHYLGVPYNSDTEFDELHEYHQVSLKEILEADEDKVVIRARVTVIRVSTWSGEIAETYQQESITSYSRLREGMLKMESSIKAFDANGTATSLTNNVAKIHRSKPYSAVDYENGKNLKALFVEYLKGHGLTMLVPD